MSKINLDHPLNVDIEDGQLVVRIGIERLAYCSEHDDGSPFKGRKVTDPIELVKGIVFAMTDEDEQGYMPVMEFLDKMQKDAIGNGCLGIEA